MAFTWFRLRYKEREIAIIRKNAFASFFLECIIAADEHDYMFGFFYSQ